MENVPPSRRFENFNAMYNYCLSLYVELIQYTDNDPINKYRQVNSKEILNGYFVIGCISEVVAKAINAKTCEVKFSVDSLLKNIIEHPEIGLKEYQTVGDYLFNAEYVLYKNSKNVIYFFIDKNIYQFVIKTTKDGKENFITTFHRASIKQLAKDLKRYKSIKK